MKKELIAFVSLGFGCNGPELGEYGKFSVDLSDDEWAKVDKICEDKNIKGYKRNAVYEQYPEIDKKIREAGQDLVERISLMITIVTGLDFINMQELIKEDIKSGAFKTNKNIDFDDESLAEEWENWEKQRIMAMPSKERFTFVKKRYDLIDVPSVESICGDLCYYISMDELPKDFKG